MSGSPLRAARVSGSQKSPGSFSLGSAPSRSSSMTLWRLPRSMALMRGVATGGLRALHAVDRVTVDVSRKSTPPLASHLRHGRVLQVVQEDADKTPASV